MSANDPKRTWIRLTPPMHQEEKEGKVELAELPLGRYGMCDYSLHNVASRPAKVGDKLTTHDFGTGTRGFAASEDQNVAVCVRPGTELSFVCEVTCQPIGILCGPDKVIKYKTAILAAEPKTAVEVEAQRRGRTRWLTLTLAFNSVTTRAGAAV